MRVLILAEHCNPDWPSLPVVGYKAAKAIARHAEVVVATHVRNRPQISREGLGDASVVYLDSEYIAKPIYKLSTLLRGGSTQGWTIAMSMAYPGQLAFEWEAWKRFGPELKRGGFDLVHRLTPMSPTLPSPMARWSPRPFLLGPLNGGLKWPPQFREELQREREWLSKLRGAYRFLPYHRSTYRCAAGILASFEHTIVDLPAECQDKVIDFPEVGIDPEVFGSDQPRPRRDRKTVLYVGRLVPYKLPEVIVRAFAQNPALRRHRLLIVGNGPEQPRLEAMVREQGLASCVEFAGWKTQQEVGQLMRESEIFAFPSIRELGAGVVVEAMASQMACVVVDYGAPGALVGGAEGGRGVRVPLGGRDELVRHYAHALAQLVDDDARIEHLGRAAREHVMRDYTWDAKARKTIAVYEWLLGQRSTKPVFYGAKGPAAHGAEHEGAAAEPPATEPPRERSATLPPVA